MKNKWRADSWSNIWKTEIGRCYFHQHVIDCCGRYFEIIHECNQHVHYLSIKNCRPDKTKKYSIERVIFIINIKVFFFQYIFTPYHDLWEIFIPHEDMYLQYINPAWLWWITLDFMMEISNFDFSWCYKPTMIIYKFIK